MRRVLQPTVDALRDGILIDAAWNVIEWSEDGRIAIWAERVESGATNLPAVSWKIVAYGEGIGRESLRVFIESEEEAEALVSMLLAAIPAERLRA